MRFHQFEFLFAATIAIQPYAGHCQTKTPEDLQSDSSLRSIASSFSEVTRNELVQLKENVSLGKWRELHPSDSLVRFGYETRQLMTEEWCMRADRSFPLPSGKIAWRKAYFYAPPPSRTLKLPILNDSLQVRMTEPILGMILLQLEEGRRGIGECIADSVRRQLSSVFGIGKIDEKLWGYGGAGWTHSNRWESGNRIFASAYGLDLDDGNEPMVFACGFLPISSFHVDFDYNDYSPGGVNVDIDSLIYRKTIQLLGQYRENAFELTEIYSKVRRAFGYSPHATFPEVRASIGIKDVVTPFRTWFQLTRNADTHIRGAALVLADQVVRLIAPILDETDSLVISQFQQLGASIRQSRTMGWIYESTWAEEARSLDPTSPASDLAVMIMMQRGFQLDAGINDCGRCYIRIIREGENLLTRSTDKDICTWTHFTLGYAYRDVVAIASGYPTLTEEDESFHMNVDVARSKAIEHFREAISVDGTSVQARSAWRDAWRLIAGIPPQGTSFTFVDE